MVTRVGSDSEEEDGALIVPTSATATPLPRSLHALDHIALSGDSDGEEGASLILPTVSRTAATTATPTRPPTPTSWMQHNRAALERVAIVIAASLVFFVALQSVRLRSDIATLLKKVEVATTAESAAAAAPTTAPRAPKVTPHTAPHAKRHATYAPAAGMARTVDYIEGRLPRWGPCWNQWDVDGSFTKAVYNETGHAVQYDSGLEVAIPPRPNTKDPWLYEPNHEQTHHETFYPYEQDKLFTWVVDKPTKDGKLVVRGTHVKTVPAHWVVKARIVGPAIVFMPCTRATAPSTSTSFVCTVNAVDPGSYRLEVVLHRKGNYWATNNQDTRTMNPGRSCGVSNAAQYRSMCGDAPHTTHFSPQSLMKHPFAMCGCAAGSAWLTHPDLAAEYVLNRTAAFVVVLGLSSPSPPVERSVRNDTTKRMQQLRAGHHPRTPLCTDGTHAGRWLRLSSMELLGALNGSAYAGSNLDWIQDLVGHNRGWLWAPYDWCVFLCPLKHERMLHKSSPRALSSLLLLMNECSLPPPVSLSLSHTHTQPLLFLHPARGGDMHEAMQDRPHLDRQPRRLFESRVPRQQHADPSPWCNCEWAAHQARDNE